MPVLRNPFRKQDENVRPGVSPLQSGDKSNTGSHGGTKPLDIPEKQPTEFQLSEINDSGVYLPPSPPERKSFWSTTSSRSTTSTNHRSAFNENEPFNISRESFDSYRRSFDISARSPIIQAASEARPPRASLDSRTFQPPPPPPRSSNSFQRPSQVPAQTNEENFEDVDIADPTTRPPQQQQPAVKKRGIFSRMVDGGDHAERPATQDGGGGSAATPAAMKQGWTHHLPGVGRKRGQSGQDSELGAIPQREGQNTPKPESQARSHKEAAAAAAAAQPHQTNGVVVASAVPPHVNGVVKKSAVDKGYQAEAGAAQPQDQKKASLDQLERRMEEHEAPKEEEEASVESRQQQQQPQPNGVVMPVRSKDASSLHSATVDESSPRRTPKQQQQNAQAPVVMT